MRFSFIRRAPTKRLKRRTRLKVRVLHKWHLGFLIYDSPCPRRWSSLDRCLDRLVVAIAVMIRPGPFGFFRTDRRGVSRADCKNVHSEVLSRITRGPTDCVKSLRLSAMS